MLTLPASTTWRGLSTDAPLPLLLCISEKVPNLLLPPQSSISYCRTSHEALQAIHDHYMQSHFVGGMGESDPGVWFIGSYDPEVIEETKLERHGVPFGLFTNGLDPEVPTELDVLQVSLYAGSPSDYAKVTGGSASDFGRICGFIAQASEQGVAVEAGVLKEFVGKGARDLALSLGAQDVHIYE